MPKVDQDPRVERSEGEDDKVDLAAAGEVGIVVVKDGDESSRAKGEDITSSMKPNTSHRRRNIIIGIFVALIVIIAIAVGAALGTRTSSEAGTSDITDLSYPTGTPQDDTTISTPTDIAPSSEGNELTDIVADGLSMELQGISGPLPADAVAVFEKEYCEHFSRYYANDWRTGKTRDEVPILQRPIGIVDCSIEVDRSLLRRLRHHRRLSTVYELDKSLTLFYSQEITVEAPFGLFLPIRDIIEVPFKSTLSKLSFFGRLHGGHTTFQDLTRTGNVVYPDSSETCPVTSPRRLFEPAMPMPPPDDDLVEIDNPICPLCPEGWVLNPAMASNTTPLKGYAADITAALDPFIEYEYILAVLAFEPCGCAELDYMLKTKKLDNLIAGRAWVGEICGKLQRFLLGRCCMASGETGDADSPPDETGDGAGYPSSCRNGERRCPNGECIVWIECCGNEQLCPTTGGCMDASVIDDKCPPCFKDERQCPDGKCIAANSCCDNEEICPTTKECVDARNFDNHSKCPPCYPGERWCPEDGENGKCIPYHPEVCCENEELCPTTKKCVGADYMDSHWACPPCYPNEKWCRKEGGESNEGRCIPKKECCNKKACLDGTCPEDNFSDCCKEDRCPDSSLCPSKACGCKITCWYNWPVPTGVCCCIPRDGTTDCKEAWDSCKLTGWTCKT